MSRTQYRFCLLPFFGDDENNQWTVIDRVDIPIGYYMAGHGQQAMYGNILELSSTYARSVEEFCDIYKNYYMEKHHIDPEIYGTYYEYQRLVSVITCLKCTYLNLLDEEENIYYMIGPSGLVSQISQERGTAWFQKYEDMKEDSFFLYFALIEEGNVEAATQMIDQIRETEKQYLTTDDLVA